MNAKLKKIWAFLRNPEEIKKYSLWIFRQTKRFWIPLILMTAVNILLVLVSFGSSFVSREIVDSATSGMEYRQAFIIMILLTAVSIAMGVGLGIFQTLINERFTFSIRTKTFHHVLTADYLKLSKFHSGDVLTRITSDAGSVAGSIASAIPSLVMIFVRLIIAFVLLYRFSPFLALSALLLAPGGLIVSIIAGPKLKKLSLEAKENEAAYRSFLQERTTHIPVVKTFCMEDESRRQLDELIARTIKTTMKRTRLGVITSTLIRCLFTLGYLISFGYCISGLHSGSLSYGTMTLFLSLFSQIQQPLAGLSSLIPQAIGIIASADRIMDLENIPDEPRTGNTTLPLEVGVQFEDVSFSYNEKNVLEHISFTAEPHQIIGIMGPSGVGKTTLIRVILALVQPRSGKVVFRYDGKEEAVSADVRRMIAYVPQGNTLLSGTIRENLRWGNPNATEEEMYQALDNADAGFVRTLPMGLDCELGEKATGLSEGQAQRIAIARALLRRAPILVLDEATSALDEDSEKAILTHLSSNRDTYVPLCFIITHRRSMVPYFDSLIDIRKNGSINITQK